MLESAIIMQQQIIVQISVRIIVEANMYMYHIIRVIYRSNQSKLVHCHSIPQQYRLNLLCTPCGQSLEGRSLHCRSKWQLW